MLCTSIPSICYGLHDQWRWHCSPGSFICLAPQTGIDVLHSQDAQANGFVAVLKHNAEAKMGVLHAAYGTYHGYVT